MGPFMQDGTRSPALVQQLCTGAETWQRFLSGRFLKQQALNAAAARISAVALLNHLVF
jgi:hypothetical protein